MVMSRSLWIVARNLAGVGKVNKPRKKYRPKPINRLAHIVAMRGVALLHRNDVLRCSLNVHTAVDFISHGRGTKELWQDLSMAINVMEELVRMKKAKDDGAIESMQNTVVAILDRQKQTKTKALHAEELANLRDVAATYTDLLSGLTHSELFEAHERTRARMRRVLSTGAPDVRVITAPEGIE